MPNKLGLAAIAVAMVTGLAGSATFALFTSTPGQQPAGAAAQRYVDRQGPQHGGDDDSGDTDMSAGRIQVVSWRGGGDAVPPSAPEKGWPAPMFYTTPAQGAYPGPPAGTSPTGAWAPGDTWQRSLHIKNRAESIPIRAEALDAVLYGNLALAPWYQVDLRDLRGRLLYRGTLADLAKEPQRFADATGKRHHLPIGVNKQRTLIFTVTLSKATPNALQGQTLNADLRVYVAQNGHRGDEDEDDDRDDGDREDGRDRGDRGGEDRDQHAGGS